MNLLDQRPDLEDFLAECAAVLTDADVELMRQEAVHRLVNERDSTLMLQWYASLERGEPDYGIYGDPRYLGEVWASWAGYSRKSLREARKLLAAHPVYPAERVTDLGCGVGITTGALTEMFPGALVVGTQLPDTLQYRIAERYAARYGFALSADPPPHTDVAVALEYFEHFFRPVEELHRVLETRPELLVIANAFGAISAGHFPRYEVDGHLVDPKAASRAFGRALRDRGYRILAAGWNNRPVLWVQERGLRTLLSFVTT